MQSLLGNRNPSIADAPSTAEAKTVDVKHTFVVRVEDSGNGNAAMPEPEPELDQEPQRDDNSSLRKTFSQKRRAAIASQAGLGGP